MKVYFIAQRDTGHVKIGFSKDPEQRMADISHQTPHHLTLMGCVEGGKAVERLWHDKWDHVRVPGKTEWFHLAPELESAIVEATSA